MHIMIIGAGSLGLLFASKLAAYGTQLTVVTKTQEQASELAERGITLVGEDPLSVPNGKPIVFCSYINETSIEIEDRTRVIDYIFLMVKQTAITPDLIHFIQSQMSAHTYLICFQNGIGHELTFGQAIGHDKLLIAVTTEGAKRNGLTLVAHTGRGVTYIGSLESTEQQDGYGQHILLENELNLAGFRTVLSKNMDVRIWSKLVINAVINPLTAILRVQNGDLLHSEWSRSLMQDLYQEAIRLAAAKGIILPDELWDTIIEVCQATKTNHSSMLQDIEASRHTEVDFMNGSLVKMGNEQGLELPTHRLVYRMIKAIEN